MTKRVAVLQRCVQVLAEQKVIAPLYQATNSYGTSTVYDVKKNVSSDTDLERMTKSE